MEILFDYSVIVYGVLLACEEGHYDANVQLIYCIGQCNRFLIGKVNKVVVFVYKDDFIVFLISWDFF